MALRRRLNQLRTFGLRVKTKREADTLVKSLRRDRGVTGITKPVKLKTLGLWVVRWKERV